eukprot:Lithocolla_globosa_v1_NODE_290_length_4624_cov_1165.781571.p2 type:complete len:303 gc:universal NODE_290_length_4624_cov_1165.781571:1257-2165(+)
MEDATYWETLYETMFERTYSERIFRSNFGISTNACQYLWALILLHFGEYLSPQHLLWALCFLKCYDTIDSMHLKFPHCSEKSYRTWVWRTLFCLYHCLNEIDFESRFDLPPLGGIFEGLFLFAVLDTTACRIQRPSSEPWQKLFYSGKHKFHCLKYEVVVRIRDGVIVFISRMGAPGSIHDLTVYRKGLLPAMIHIFEHLLADKAYICNGLPFVTPYKGNPCYLSDFERKFNCFMSTFRVIVERTIGRMKSFSCLRQQWRHDLDLHHIAFSVCAHLTNINIREFGMFSDEWDFTRKSRWHEV